MVGVMLGGRLGRTPASKAVLGIVLGGLGIVAVVSLSGLGCAMGGYQLVFH